MKTLTKLANYIRGLGSILDLGVSFRAPPRTSRPLTLPMDDNAAIRSAWTVVGQDIQQSFRQVRETDEQVGEREPGSREEERR